MNNVAYIISSILVFVFCCIVTGGAVAGAKYAAIYFVARVIIRLINEVCVAVPARRTCFQ